MDTLGGFAESGNKIEEKGVTVGKDIDFVVLKRETEILIGEKVYRDPVSVGHIKVLLHHKLEHGALGELVKAPLAHQLVATGVTTKKEVKQQTDNWHKINHQHPSHCLGGLSVVHQDMDNGHNLDGLVDYKEQCAHIKPFLPLFSLFSFRGCRPRLL